MGAPAHIRNKFAQAVGNGVTLVTIFTHGTNLVDPTGEASGRGGVLDHMEIVNEDTVQHTVNVYRVPAGGSADATNRVEPAIIIPAGQKYRLEGPYYSADSDLWRAKYGEAKTTTEVNFMAHYHEMASV